MNLMRTENDETYSFEDFIGSNAAFSFLSSSFSVECLQTFVVNMDTLLVDDMNTLDDNFIVIRKMCCDELETLKNMKLALFKFMNSDDIEFYDKFMENMDTKLSKRDKVVNENGE